MKQVSFSGLIVHLILSLLLFVPVITKAQAGKMDFSFNPNDLIASNVVEGANHDVKAMALQPDGKIIIAGLFTAYFGKMTNYITRINSDGSVDASFNTGGMGTNAPVSAVVLQPDGKILISGAFTQYNGSTAISCIRLHADGSRDQAFQAGGGANGAIRTMQLQPDGKILLGGSFSAFNGQVHPYIVRLQNNGAIDESFNAMNGRVSGTVISMAIQQDGAILVGMEKATADYLCRLLPNGHTDSSFNTTGTGADQAVRAICIQQDQKILIGGNFDQYNGNTGKLIRILQNGNIDATFSNSAHDAYNGGVNLLLQQPNGKILVSWGEQKSSFLDPEGRKLERLNVDGTVDAAFKYKIYPYLNENIYCMLLQPDGKILTGQTLVSRYSNRGYGVNYEAGTASKNFHIKRINASGAEDISFCILPTSTGANGTVKAVVIQPDGKIITGGNFYTYNGKAVNYLARLLADGTIDNSFNANGVGPNSSVTALALLPNGKLLVAGIFTDFNAIENWFIIRLNSNGSRDASFQAQYNTINAYSTIQFIKVLPDGKILVGAEGQSNALLRLFSDGSTDPTFIPLYRNSLPYNVPVIHDAVQQPDGKLITVGHFDKLQGSSFLRHVARVNTDGTIDLSFNPSDGQSYMGCDNDVTCVALQIDEKIIIAGNFTSYTSTEGTTSAGRITRLLPDGKIDISFNSNGQGANGKISTLLLLPDQKILIAGDFTTYNEVPANRIMRLLPDGNIDPEFNANASGANGAIFKMALQPDLKKMIIAGSFTGYNSSVRNRIARIYACNPVNSITDVSICPSQLPYSWNGNSYSSAGTYSITLNSLQGCDSVAVLNLATGISGISGPNKACAYLSPNAGPATYRVTAPQGSTFTWSLSNNNTMQILSGQSSSTVQVVFSDSFTTGNIYVSVRNSACGLSARPSLAVSRSNPSTPGIITPGTTAICSFIGSSSGINYSIRKVAGATGYLWEGLSPDMTIIHPNGTGVNDTLVTIVYANNFTSSSIRVSSLNDCGASNARSLAVARSIPTIPGGISGPTQVCDYLSTAEGERAVYTVAAIPGLTYNWSAPAGAIIFGQGSNSVSFYFPAGFVSGTVSVSASNGCGTSSIRSLTVKASAASSPSNILAGENATCPNRLYTYSIPSLPANASGLLWTVPAGAILLSGQGSTTIQVNFPSGSLNGFIGVQAFNSCGTSSTRKLLVSLPSCGRTVPYSRSLDNESPLSKMMATDFDVTVYPNPSATVFQLKLKTVSTEPVRCRLYDAGGKTYLRKVFTGSKFIVLDEPIQAGVYFLEIEQGENHCTRKLIKL